MDFNLQPDTPEISVFRKEVREWLAENMRGSEHLRWSARWSTRENDDEYLFRPAGEQARTETLAVSDVSGSVRRRGPDSRSSVCSRD
jgi:hypothetical protein